MSWSAYRATEYLSYPKIEDFLHSVASALPEWVELEVIGKTGHGRSIYLITIGKQDEHINDRPAIWLDGGTHAAEWTGVMTALYTASSWLEGLANDDQALQAQFSQSTAYILPCISPDGYEALINGEAFIRSTISSEQTDKTRSGFEPQDIDGDGVVRWMRWKHPAGSFVVDENQPSLMRARTLDDAPEEAYFFCEEGLFINWDGSAWNYANLKNGIDLNRNFPGHWQPFSMFGQNAGQYAMSEPESAATVEAFAKRPHICAALTNHTHTGCILTQPYRENSPLSEADIQLMHTLASDLVSDTNYRVYKVFPEFTYSDKERVIGVWSDTISTVFGVPGYTVEFWDPYGHAGFTIDKPIENLINPKAELLSKVYSWYGENYPQLISPWKIIQHPQLGQVEVGGFNAMQCIFNPPEKVLKQECDKGLKFANRLLRSLPTVACEVSVEPVGDDCFRIQAKLINLGYLSTSPLESGKNLVSTPDVFCRIALPTGVNCLSGKLQQLMPHLQGWANQFAGLGKNPTFPGLASGSHCYAVEWLIQGKGEITLHWQAGRAGTGTNTIKITHLQTE